MLFRFQARGTENVPRDGPALLLVNHQSYLDPIILGLALERPVVMLARRNLLEFPILGPYLRGLYGVPIDRDNPGTRVIRELVRRLDHGFLVAVYPEGTRGSATELGPIKPGFISILRRADVPVIPVGLAGANARDAEGRLVYPPGDDSRPLRQSDPLLGAVTSESPRQGTRLAGVRSRPDAGRSRQVRRLDRRCFATFAAIKVIFVKRKQDFDPDRHLAARARPD